MVTRHYFPLWTVSIPSSILQAAKERCWQKAMAKELLALKVNHTWIWFHAQNRVLVLEASMCNTIKVKSDGTLDRYKARLVVQGYKKEYGIDYEEILLLWLKWQLSEFVKCCCYPKLAVVANGCEKCISMWRIA